MYFLQEKKIIIHLIHVLEYFLHNTDGVYHENLFHIWTQSHLINNLFSNNFYI